MSSVNSIRSAWVQVEAFSGKTAVGVPIEERVVSECNAEEQEGKVKYRRKINCTVAYRSIKFVLIGMFIKKMIRSALSVFDRQVAANTEIVPLGRDYKTA